MDRSWTYQGMLQDELVKRSAVNRRYSLRRFAQHISVSPAFLSQLLNGKRTLGVDKAMQISSSLEWPQVKSQKFLNLVILDRTSDETVKSKLLREIQKSNPKFTTMRADQMEIVSDWRYTALMEMSGLKDFRSDPRWIARRLGLTVIEARAMIDRLVRVGLLNRNSDQTLSKSTHHNASFDDIPTKAIQNYHRAVLKRAAESLNDPPRRRELRSMTVAIDPSRLEAIKQKIRRFEDEMAEFMEEGSRTAVFQFSMQFFRVDCDFENTHLSIKEKETGTQ